jgi:outer membrane protein OmpA-like peptidoglycan-associated protein
MFTLRSAALSVSLAALVGLGACDAPPPGVKPQPEASENCVVLAEGFYEFQDGQFLAVTAESLQVTSGTGPEREIQSGFAALGFPWMGLKLRDRVATLTGTAPSAEAKAAAFAAGESAIASQAPGGRSILVVDGISVEGGERGVGDSLIQLSDSGITVDSCQRAFAGTMEGRNIQFESGNARISPVSARLLDAVTGVATLCGRFVIEIGGHTDSRGADDFNLRLSQERADAVLAYLASKGVPQENLLAIGYGETRPIDPALTVEAYEKNRRTEFKVIQR